MLNLLIEKQSSVSQATVVEHLLQLFNSHVASLCVNLFPFVFFIQHLPILDHACKDTHMLYTVTPCIFVS